METLGNDLGQLESVIDGVRKTDAQRGQIVDARNSLSKLNRDLSSNANLTPEERSSLTDKAKAAAASLSGLEKRFLAAALKATKDKVQDLAERRETYQQSVKDARGALKEAKDPASYWRDLKGNFLSQVGTVGGEDLRSLLGNAFNNRKGIDDIAVFLQDSL